MERELGWACSLVQSLLAITALEDNELTHDARNDALGQFEQLPYPAAQLDRSRTFYTNEAWRHTFTEATPAWAKNSVEMVLRTGITVHLPEVPVEIRGRRVWLTATLKPARGNRSCAVMVCAEMTDAMLGRELALGTGVLMWSGHTNTPASADYCNQQVREACPKDFDLGSWQTLIHASDRAKWQRMFNEATRRGASSAIDLRVCSGDTYRWHTTKVLIATNQSRWFTLAYDCHNARSLESERTELVDRLRAARVDAEQAHRLKDQVLAAVSHELRSPVTTMMLWERVLRDPSADTAAREQALDAIHQSANAQSRIVADLLDMSRAISGKLYVDFRNVELSRLVEDAVQAATPLAAAKRITITNDTAGFRGEIPADAARLRQVIDNLLSNAIKFTEPGGRVTVTVLRKGRVVLVRVADNGRGIAPGLLQRIFEPFSQGEDTISRREGGLGLGLAIARQIVELHHGSLVAESEGPARGAVFTVSLPIAGHRRAASPPAGVVPALALKSVHVLVVDDDERVRNALALLLDRAGAIVDRAESAATARDQIARRPPQIILCDIAMPDEDGYELIRALRASGNKTPAIALTAYASRTDAEQAIAAGFDLHVAKPIDFERLIASVTQVISSKHERRN
jgi:signal transduction histidine kinase/ActR/RegA family two-component response regulator